MQGLPVCLRPPDDLVVVDGLWIDTHDDMRPGGVTIAPRRVLLAHMMCRTVDRKEVHGGVERRDFGAICDVLCNGGIAQLIHEVSPPVPLQAWWIQSIEHAL